jgi:hypothetical protein
MQRIERNNNILKKGLESYLRKKKIGLGSYKVVGLEI